MMSSSSASLTKPLAPVNTAPEAATESSSTNEGGSKLIVGPNIKLKGGQITDCDTLVVEGRVEATMDARDPDRRKRFVQRFGRNRHRPNPRHSSTAN